jgi:hypothetical protein
MRLPRPLQLRMLSWYLGQRSAAKGKIGLISPLATVAVRKLDKMI